MSTAGVAASLRTARTELIAALTHRDVSDPHEASQIIKRRRIVVVIALIAGATFQGLSLSAGPGDGIFYVYTAALAGVWTIGAFAARPLHLGRITWRGHRRPPVITGIAVGAGLGVFFILGGLIVREIGPLKRLIADVFSHATQGNMIVVLVIAVITGIAEELFFRGALYSALDRFYPVIASTAIYFVVTLASGNPMLGFAAILLGLVAAIERRATDGVLAPMLTHATWTLIVFGGLPPLFGV